MSSLRCLQMPAPLLECPRPWSAKHSARWNTLPISHHSWDAEGCWWGRSWAVKAIFQLYRYHWCHLHCSPAAGKVHHLPPPTNRSTLPWLIFRLYRYIVPLIPSSLFASSRNSTSPAATNKLLYFVLVNLEKVFHHVLRKVLWWDLRSHDFEDCAVHVIQGKYSNAQSCVRVNGQ